MTGVEADKRAPEKVCDVDGCNAWKSGDFDKCHHHKGVNDDGSSHRNNNNGQKHGLHTSAETFFANADEHHVDHYYAIHESLCSQYEAKHGELPYHIKKDLSEIAFEMAKLDIAKEYEAENAVDPAKPLTEEHTIGFDQETMQEVTVEQVSKVESLKTDIRRENRLALKDMGIYQSPEKQAAEAQSDMGEKVARILQGDGGE
jgi:hypothetical protein